MEQYLTADRITILSSGLMPRRHRLLIGEEVLGELSVGLGFTATFGDAEGRQLRLRRTSLWRGEYEVREGRQVLGSAHQPLFQRWFDVRFADASFLLLPRGLGFYLWELRDETGAPLLALRWRLFGGGEISLSAPVESDLLAFVAYLTLMRRRVARRR